MQKWFMLGLFLSVVLLFIPAVTLASVNMTLAEAELVVLVTLFVGSILRLASGNVSIMQVQRQRPHTLFTPYYDQL